ncbi:MAG TPA: tetraacyldisaccharide 4'-kinase [Caulobacteraceae bacterium]|jgi:tetraacyldisaccharide 4'-kinase|nr:tetraacyldisaccharide 4'-kinase [Caulobacteraceae bacterium]
MRFSTPRGWYRREGSGFRALNLILVPLSWVWAAVTARRLARADAAYAGAPVICVGNLTLGGSGKTPVVRAIAARLAAAGVNAHVLSRGHGGAVPGPLRVDPALHDAVEVGDEALMLAADGLPVWIARDRLAGARAAAAAGAQAIVMDDGHQNPRVRKTLSLVVVDGETRDGEWPFGDGRVFPAGPLRESVRAGLARADAVILLLPADFEQGDPRLIAALTGRPVLIARLAALAPPPPGPQLGFAGVAKPWKVERALAAAGAELVDFAPLADHAPLREPLLRALADRASALGAGLVTTEKDWVRLPSVWRSRIAAWRVGVSFDDEPALDVLLGRLHER